MRRRTFSNNRGLPLGTTLNFDYTGKVQEVTLPPGRYKLQCWGAQGGNSGSYSGTGSKGGYSEGELTVTKTTTFYVFVGGKGAYSGNGGFNGGGGSTGSSSYNSGSTYGCSYPACGGGATDIATVTSDMDYSSRRNNRSAASLLSRCIVAGGGAGGSARYTSDEYTSMEYVYKATFSASSTYTSGDVYARFTSKRSISSGAQFKLVLPYLPELSNYSIQYYNSAGTQILADNISPTIGTSYQTAPSGAVNFWVGFVKYGSFVDASKVTADFYMYESTTSTSSSSGSSNSAQQGGGTSGRGTSPGTQNGGGGEFGKGKNQDITNYRYASGAGGGGWYGGGSSYSDSSTSYINSSGGGSGFVNIAANASYRPSGYTGLELDSGSTKDGATSFPAPSGGNETGHSGNGYARIIAVDKDGNYPVVKPAVEIVWSTRSGTWNNSTNSSAADGKQFTCVSPGTNGSTVLRCTFSGVSQIVFRCRYQGESNYDYLTIGNLDTA